MKKKKKKMTVFTGILSRSVLQQAQNCPTREEWEASARGYQIKTICLQILDTAILIMREEGDEETLEKKLEMLRGELILLGIHKQMHVELGEEQYRDPVIAGEFIASQIVGLLELGVPRKREYVPLLGPASMQIGIGIARPIAGKMPEPVRRYMGWLTAVRSSCLYFDEPIKEI